MSPQRRPHVSSFVVQDPESRYKVRSLNITPTAKERKRSKPSQSRCSESTIIIFQQCTISYHAIGGGRHIAASVPRTPNRDPEPINLTTSLPKIKQEVRHGMIHELKRIGRL